MTQLTYFHGDSLVSKQRGKKMVNLWITHYELLCWSISHSEINFVMEHFSKNDKGEYTINNDNLMEIEKEMSKEEKEKFGSLLSTIKGGLKREYGYLAIEMA